MSEIKHTPGPWVIGPRYSHDVQTPDGNDIGAVCDAEQGGEEGEIAGNIPWSEEIAEANARLIAAAPELLEVAKACREVCLFGDDDGIGASEDVVIPSALFDRICAAINKAEGRS